MKKLCLALLMLLLLPTSVLAQDVDIKINTERNTVGNMNYRIIKDNELYKVPLDVMISSTQLEKDIKLETIDGNIYIKDLAFGEYEIEVCDNKSCQVFIRSINDISVLSQHKPQDLVLENRSLEVPDTNAKQNKFIMFGLTMIVALIVTRRAYEKNY